MSLGLQPRGHGLDSPSASLSVCPTGGASLWPPEGSELREAVTIHQPQCVPRSLAALHLFWNVPSSSLAPGPSGQRGVATWVSGCCEASVGPRGGERDRGQQWEGRARAPGPQRDFAGELLAAPGLTGCREPGFRLAHVSHRAEAVRLTPVYFLIPLEIRSKGGESGPSPPPSPVQPRDRALGIRRRPLLLLLGPPGPGLPHPAPANRLAPHLARPGSPPGPMGLHLPWSHSLQLYFEEWVPCPTDVPCVLRKP